LERASWRLIRKSIKRRRYHRRYQRIRQRRIEAGFQHWLKSKPRSVRRLAAEFKVGDRFMLDGKIHYLYGYNESGQLLLSEYNPAKSEEFYQLGCKNIKYVCASHFRREANASTKNHP
jgi:hypothetical protein